MIKPIINYCKSCSVHTSTFCLNAEFIIPLAVVSLISFLNFDNKQFYNNVLESIPNLLTVLSILFGFTVTTLLFYIELCGKWDINSDSKLRLMSKQIVDDHVQTILIMIFAMGVMYLINLFDIYKCIAFPIIQCLITALLLLGILYPLCKILNHVLSIRSIYFKTLE